MTMPSEQTRTTEDQAAALSAEPLSPDALAAASPEEPDTSGRAPSGGEPQQRAVAGTPEYAKLKDLLLELFQLDQPELDFGVYRVMRARASEIAQFLERDLLPQVAAAFGVYRTADKAELEKELAKALAQAKDLGADSETLPKVQGLRKQLAEEAVDIAGLEREVYEHLYRFFRRYYADGDFLAKRVYKPGIFALPYEGEEVKFYWANRDQYYIKTSEYLRDYSFRLRPDDDAQPMRVHFRLMSATEGTHGTTRPADDTSRAFIPLAGNDKPIWPHRDDLIWPHPRPVS